MKRTVIGALMALIVASTIAVPVVQAQQTILTANVPFAFNVGDKQLPAAAYSVREMGRVTLIQSKDYKESALGLYNYTGPSKAEETKLVFHQVGDRYFLAEIWSRGEGLAVPQSKLEKEMRASNSNPQGGVETVIVALR